MDEQRTDFLAFGKGTLLLIHLLLFSWGLMVIQLTILPFIILLLDKHFYRFIRLPIKSLSVIALPCRSRRPLENNSISHSYVYTIHPDWGMLSPPVAAPYPASQSASHLASIHNLLLNYSAHYGHYMNCGHSNKEIIIPSNSMWSLLSASLHRHNVCVCLYGEWLNFEGISSILSHTHAATIQYNRFPSTHCRNKRPTHYL